MDIVADVNRNVMVQDCVPVEYNWFERKYYFLLFCFFVFNLVVCILALLNISDTTAIIISLIMGIITIYTLFKMYKTGSYSDPKDRRNFGIFNKALFYPGKLDLTQRSMTNTEKISTSTTSYLSQNALSNI